MSNNNEKVIKYRDILISTYCFRRSLYSFSFKERVGIDIGTLTFNFRYSDKELESLSDEELEDKLTLLKKPWWNSLYKKYLHKHNKRLWLIFLLFIRRDYSWSGIKLICKVIRTKKEEYYD